MRSGWARLQDFTVEQFVKELATLWLFREKLAKAGLIEKLFERFDQHLAAKGYIARGDRRRPLEDRTSG